MSLLDTGVLQEILNKRASVIERIRSENKVIKQRLKKLSAILSSIHYNGTEKIPEICQNARQELELVKKSFETLMNIVPENQYYNYRDRWRYYSNKTAHQLMLLVYLESGRLCSRKEFAEVIGVDINQMRGSVNTEYLFGMTHMVSDLARYAVTSVTYHDYEKPIEILNFVLELCNAFGKLICKHESLRKRLDSMKYDVKRIEEVIYDLSLRKQSREGDFNKVEQI